MSVFKKDSTPFSISILMFIREELKKLTEETKDEKVLASNSSGKSK